MRSIARRSGVPSRTVPSGRTTKLTMYGSPVAANASAMPCASLTSRQRVGDQVVGAGLGQGRDLGGVERRGSLAVERLLRAVRVAAWADRAADHDRRGGGAVARAQLLEEAHVVAVDGVRPERRPVLPLAVRAPRVGGCQHGHAERLADVQVLAVGALQHRPSGIVVDQRGVGDLVVEPHGRLAPEALVERALAEHRGVRQQPLERRHPQHPRSCPLPRLTSAAIVTP